MSSMCGEVLKHCLLSAPCPHSRTFFTWSMLMFVRVYSLPTFIDKTIQCTGERRQFVYAVEMVLWATSKMVVKKYIYVRPLMQWHSCVHARNVKYVQTFVTVIEIKTRWDMPKNNERLVMWTLGLNLTWPFVTFFLRHHFLTSHTTHTKGLEWRRNGLYRNLQLHL